MTIHLIREHRRWRAVDDTGTAHGYGESVKEAVIRWADNWDDILAAQEALANPVRLPAERVFRNG